MACRLPSIGRVLSRFLNEKFMIRQYLMNRVTHFLNNGWLTLLLGQGTYVIAAMSSFWKSVTLRSCECKMLGDHYFATAPSHGRSGWVCWKWVFFALPGSKSLFKHSSRWCQLDFPHCLLGSPYSIYFKEPKLNYDGSILMGGQLIQTLFLELTLFKMIRKQR